MAATTVSSSVTLSPQTVSVRIVCGSEELKVTGSRFLSEDPARRRIQSMDDIDKTIETYINKYQGTGTQFSLTEGDPSRGAAKWIVTPRYNSLAASTDVKGMSKSKDTSYLNAVIREFQEEIGSDIPSSYFYQETPTTFCLNIDPAGKNILEKNYKDLKPATEIWSINWVPSTKVCSGTKVPASAITQADITKRVIAAKQRLAAISAANKSSVTASLVTPGTVSVTWPSPNTGESRDDYIKRVTGTGPGRSADATKAYANTLMFKAGRRTIRRKKSRHSKKRGTLKKGVRR